MLSISYSSISALHSSGKAESSIIYLTLFSPSSDMSERISSPNLLSKFKDEVTDTLSRPGEWMLLTLTISGDVGRRNS